MRGAPEVARAEAAGALDLSGRILVALALDEASVIALVRADAMAHAAGAALHALYVVPPTRRINALFPQRNAADALDAPARLRVAADAASGYCEAVLGDALPRERITVLEGQVVSCIVGAADELDAALIVLGDAGPRLGGARSRGIVRSVVREAGRPVLVARPSAASNAIVAATDFSDARFPALRRASELGSRTRAPVTFVHNVDSLAALVASSTFGVSPALLGASVHDAVIQGQAQLRVIADSLGERIETVIASRESAADAILEVAGERDADLVIVGSRVQRGQRRLRHDGTAEDVAARAGRCVLAVPLDGGAGLAA